MKNINYYYAQPIPKRKAKVIKKSKIRYDGDKIVVLKEKEEGKEKK